MAEDPEREQKIMQLMDITGYQYEASKNMLEIYNGNLEVTSNYSRELSKAHCRQTTIMANIKRNSLGSVQKRSKVKG